MNTINTVIIYNRDLLDFYSMINRSNVLNRRIPRNLALLIYVTAIHTELLHEQLWLFSRKAREVLYVFIIDQLSLICTTWFHYCSVLSHFRRIFYFSMPIFIFPFLVSLFRRTSIIFIFLLVSVSQIFCIYLLILLYTYSGIAVLYFYFPIAILIFYFSPFSVCLYRIRNTLIFIFKYFYIPATIPPVASQPSQPANPQPPGWTRNN